MNNALTPNQQILQSFETSHITFPRDLEFQNALLDVVDRFNIAKNPAQAPGLHNRAPQTGIFVYAPSGSGKSRLVENGLREFRHPEDGTSLDGRYITVDAPTPFTTKDLMLAILRKLGIDLHDGKEQRLAEMVRLRCHELGIYLICVDEFNRVNSMKLVGKVAKKTEAKTLGESLTWLLSGSDWPISLVLSGIDWMVALWDYEVFETCARRVLPLPLPPVDGTYRAAIAEIFRSYLEIADCQSSLPANYDMFGRLRRASKDRLGVMLWYMQRAILLARRNSNTVTADHFAGTYARKARCSATNNIFLAQKWQDVVMPATLDYEKL